jgi:hypothetical protein
MPIQARRWIRRMRGGAQAHLLEAEDGHCYVVKPTNNPQGRRILVNEWISSVFLRYLQVHTPETAFIETTPDFLDANPECRVESGSRQLPWPPGWHFGSRYPGDPGHVAVYDNLPARILERVANRTHFLGVLAFDKWVGNADARQCVFYRAETREVWERGAGRAAYVATMIDNGYAFDGPHWRFGDAPLAGFYYQHSVYSSVTGWDDLEPWLGRILGFPEQVVDQALRAIPGGWIGEDESAVGRLMETLMRRRKRIVHLLEDARASMQSNPFPNWRG